MSNTVFNYEARTKITYVGSLVPRDGKGISGYLKLDTDDPDKVRAAAVSLRDFAAALERMVSGN